jgi:hypothetical protein
MSMLAKQQQFYGGTSDVMELRTQLRQGSAIISGDLRGVSTIGGDISAMTDSSIDFRYTIGSGVACAAPSATQIIIPPLEIASGAALTSWVSKPVAGDSLFIFDDGDTTSSGDETWRKYGITAVDSVVGLCTFFTNATDNAKRSYRITVSTSGTTNIPTTVVRGAMLRFVRRAHYSLYHTSSSAPWYLGYCMGICTSSNPIQPIAGPFNAYNAVAGSGTSGIRLTYFDSSGTATANTSLVSRVSIVLRGQTRGQINVAGMGKGYYTDSLRTDVAVRNRY